MEQNNKGASASARNRDGIKPIDLSEALHRLQLGIGSAARLCGVSIRQLSYWTDKGIFSSDGDAEKTKSKAAKKKLLRSRLYDFAAIEKACLIKQGLDLGFGLEAAVAEAEAFLARKQDQEKRLHRLASGELAKQVSLTTTALGDLAERIRRGLRTYRVSGDLGRMAASSKGLEKIISFFEANPFTVNTARQIALRLGRDVAEVSQELNVLEEKKFIQKISYPGNDIYRYLPRRR